MSESQSVDNFTLDDATLEIPMNQESVREEGPQLEDILAQPEQVEEQKPETKEPGYVKKRIEAAVQKDRETYTEKIRAEIKSEYEKLIQPLLEERMERQADELVKEGEFKSKDRALEYLRLKSGHPEIKPEKSEPKSEPKSDPAEARATLLMAQANAIKSATGVDVMEIYQNDPAIRQRILSGENFSDLAPELVRKQPPSPVRTPNNAVPQRRTPMELSSDELKRLDDNLARGVRVDMRR